jgi:hypothetical protein
MTAKKNRPMPETDPSPPEAGPTEPTRNAGQSLVAAFRAARIQSRPALQAELRAERAALRMERLQRLGRGKPLPEAIAPVHAPPEDNLPAPNGENSIFSQIIDGAQAEAAKPPAAPETAEEKSVLPLSAIGFGPGMVIRFRQLGIETAADLAASDPASLRTALGDITRLINVDLWIATARKATAEAA